MKLRLCLLFPADRRTYPPIFFQAMNTPFSRYQRQLALPDFNVEHQTQLLNAKVLVAGAGGLAAPLLQYLTAAGVGNIGIADGDVVEMSNLHRQTLYSEQDIGQPKATIARQKLALLNSEITIRDYPFFLNTGNILNLMTAYDLTVDTTDNWGTRYLINDACALLKKPLVFGAIFQYEGQVSVFHYADKQNIRFNYRDVFPDIPSNEAIPNCAESGVLGILCGIIGTMQANETIKIILNKNPILAGKMAVFNLQNYQLSSFDVTQNETQKTPDTRDKFFAGDYAVPCPASLNQNIYTKEEWETLIADNTCFVLDVRHKDALPQLNVKNLIAVPLEKIEDAPLTGIKKLAALCASGIRSALAIELLKKKYPQMVLYNVKNGIHSIL